MLYVVCSIIILKEAVPMEFLHPYTVSSILYWLLVYEMVSHLIHNYENAWLLAQKKKKKKVSDYYNVTVKCLDQCRPRWSTNPFCVILGHGLVDLSGPTPFTRDTILLSNQTKPLLSVGHNSPVGETYCAHVVWCLCFDINITYCDIVLMFYWVHTM